MPDYRYLLSEREIPKFWYNVVPDLPAPMSPPLHPDTLQPAGPQVLEAIFPHALIMRFCPNDLWCTSACPLHAPSR